MSTTRPPLPPPPPKGPGAGGGGPGSAPRPPLSKEEQELEDKRAVRRDCCKRAAKFTFSQLGLVVVVCLYAVAGAFIFMHLERTNEYQQCVQGEQKYDPMENNTITKIWLIATNYRNPLDSSYAIAAFHTQLAQFRTDVLALGYNGLNCSAMNDPDSGVGYQWNFPGALLFSTTVFTTVGYGNIAPKTFWGRLVCIAYAVLGIPLMLLCLANIGEIMADVFRYVYINVCCFGYCAKRKNKLLRMREANSNMQGVRATKKLDEWKNQYNKEHHPSAHPEIVDEDEDDEEDEEDKISVPLTVTLLLIISYLGMGALLFSVWDGWDVFAAAYFCFITISTIGFGDIVPGTSNFNTVTGQLEMVGTAVYMVIGMAILSMAFNLIQEEIVTKFRWLGEKCGIIKKEDDEDELMMPTQPTVPRIPASMHLGTGVRAAGPMRVAAPPPGMFGAGLQSAGPGAGFYPPAIVQRKMPESYAPPSKIASVGPNSMYQPPPKGPAAYHP